jgi:hypothetical protein
MRTEIHIEKRAALIRAGAYVIFGLSNTPHFAGIMATKIQIGDEQAKLTIQRTY